MPGPRVVERHKRQPRRSIGGAHDDTAGGRDQPGLGIRRVAVADEQHRAPAHIDEDRQRVDGYPRLAR